MFKNVLIFCQKNDRDVFNALLSVTEFLKKENISFCLAKKTQELFPDVTSNTLSLEQIDLILTIGGDGTLLSAINFSLSSKNIPILGINKGYLGFLADLKADNLAILAQILQGNFIVDERLLLIVEIFAENGEKVAQDVALNDFVLSSIETNRINQFDIYIDDKFVCEQKADGVIISTPTGSTAHALSGGGPIIYPKVDSFLILPMFPHNLSSRPIIVDAEQKITLVTQNHQNTLFNSSCDGRNMVKIAKGYKICLRKNEQKVRLLHALNYDYFAVLQKKLFWENRN